MKLSLRIPLTLAIIVVVTGIIAFVKISTQGGVFPTNSFVLWIFASLILIGLTLRAYQQSRKQT